MTLEANPGVLNPWGPLGPGSQGRTNIVPDSILSIFTKTTKCLVRNNTTTDVKIFMTKTIETTWVLKTYVLLVL